MTCWGRRWVGENENVAILRRQIEETEVNIGNLEGTSIQFLESAAPTEALRSLRRRVEEVGLAVGGEEGDRVFVRACRAAIQARLAQGEARIRRLTELVEEARLLPSVAEGVAELERRRRRAEKELGSAGEALGQAEARQREAAGLVQELETRRVQAKTRAEALQWARETQTRYRRLLGLEVEWADAVQRAIAGLAELRERRIGMARDVRAKEQSAEKAASGVVRARGVVAELRKLAGEADTWRSDVEAVREGGAREEALARRLEQLRREEETLSSELVENGVARDGLREEIEVLERGPVGSLAVVGAGGGAYPRRGLSVVRTRSRLAGSAVGEDKEGASWGCRRRPEG